jgi:hypothetical protein
MNNSRRGDKIMYNNVEELKAFLLDTTHDIEIDDENAVFYKVYFVS